MEAVQTATVNFESVTRYGLTRRAHCVGVMNLSLYHSVRVAKLAIFICKSSDISAFTQCSVTRVRTHMCMCARIRTCILHALRCQIGGARMALAHCAMNQLL